MAIKAAELSVEIGADIDGARKDLDNAMGEIVGHLGKFGQVLTAALAGAVALGFGALTAGIGYSIAAAQESEVVQAKLNAVLKSTGGIAGWTASQANELATSLMNLTGVDDELIVSTQSMFLTFTKIGAEVIPQATEAALDMSQAFGMDATQAAIMLGKALNDPIQGVGALRRIGVMLSDEQEKQIQNFIKVGDVASAQKVILNELAVEVGGTARAYGQTFAGQLAILRGQFGNIAEDVGAELLPVLSELLTEYIVPLVPKIAELAKTFAEDLANGIREGVEWLKTASTWLGEHKGVIIAVLAAVGTAIAAFVYTTVIPAAVAMITAMAPILAVMAAVAGVAYLIYEAWNGNWLGIRDTLTALWEGTLKPIFTVMWTWLKENIPMAIAAVKEWWVNQFLPALQVAWGWIQENVFPIAEQLYNILSVVITTAIMALSDLWVNVLLPAFSAVWTFLSGTLFPIFEKIGNFLGVVFMAVINTLAAVWKDVLLPAISAVWNFVQTYLYPLFQAIGNFISAVFSVALTALAGIWENVLKPALEKVWSILYERLNPVFEAVSKFINTTLIPTIQAVAGWFSEKLKPAIDGVCNIVSRLIDWINTLADKLRNIKLPKWMTPGSPTPWEIGLRGVSSAMKDLTRASLPELETSLRVRTPSIAQPEFASQSTSNEPRSIQIINNFGDTTLDESQLLRILHKAEAMGLL